MKEKNEKFSLINLVNYFTKKGLVLVGKLGKLISNKNSHDSVEISVRIIVTLLLIAILKIPFDILKNMGVIYIYVVGSVFRQYLSNGWIFIINYVYVVTGILLFYRVIHDILKNKELNILETDRKKDIKIKKSIFIPILKTLRIILLLVLIPFVIMIAILFMLLGMNFALLINGTYLVSLFFINIGLIIINFSIILVITKFAFGEGGKA